MSRAQANGIEIEYETFGDPAAPALLLVMGFGTQLTAWDEGFCTALADRGRFVIRYDNRDVGLSTHLDGQLVDVGAVIGSLMGGVAPDVPYLLSDMAADGIGLLDALGIEKAHVLGASMGGMIAQAMAIEHPERVLTLTSVMSTTGEQEYGQSSPEAMAALLSPPPAEREDYVHQAIATWKVWASPRYWNEDYIRARAGAGYDRCFYPEGATRQLAAIYASGDRSDGLSALDVPMLVIHGRDDTLITPEGGERTAELVPGSRYLLLSDMGHDHPAPLWPVLAEAIGGHVRATMITD